MEKNSMNPADNYEDLKFQFLAMRRLLQSKSVQIDYYRKQVSRFCVERIIELEAEIESQKEMNAILTEELESKNINGTIQ